MTPEKHLKYMTPTAHTRLLAKHQDEWDMWPSDAALILLIEDAAAEEREACAKIALEIGNKDSLTTYDCLLTGQGIAAAIRARGQAPTS